MNTNLNTGERIRNLHMSKGLSQEQLAFRAEITTTYLGLIERNLKNPTIKIIEQICNALEISLAVFFNSSAEPYDSFDTLSAQILSQFSNRTEEEKQLILQIIKSTLKLRDLPDKTI